MQDFDQEDVVTHNEELKIVFDGGIASQGVLHFYEYSRSQYATARFVAVVERFRRDGTVLQRVTSQSYINILVETPQRGSFIETIIVPVAIDLAKSVVSTPLKAIVAYVWHLLVPRKQSTDEMLVRIAEIHLSESKEQTARSKEETARLAEVAKIVESQQATTQQALNLLSWALEQSSPSLGRIGADQKRLLLLTEEMRVESLREKEFLPYADQLAEIDSEAILQLTSRVRPIVREMALPLRRSAETLSFSGSEDSGTFVRIDREDAASISQNEIETETVTIVCHVRSFDRDTGVGKITAPEFSRPMSFTVPLARRALLRSRVIDAMQHDMVEFEVRQVIDGGGSVVSFILENVGDIVED